MIKWRSTNGGVAQSGEHLLCKQGVRGSNPLTSTYSANHCYLGLAEKEFQVCTRRNTTIPLEDVPWRLFLDSTVLQALHQFGGFIYDGDNIPVRHKIRVVPKGVTNVTALQNIMQVGYRANFELVLSWNSLEEVANKGEGEYMRWAFEVADHWASVKEQYRNSGNSAFSGEGVANATQLDSPKFGYLGAKDKLLLADALELECSAFLTMDSKLAKNSVHIEKHIPLKVLEPVEYWELLRPWAALFH